MPKVQFQDVDDVTEFSLIPEGQYPAEIVNVEEKETRNGDDMWKITFKIIDGDFKNRNIFSNLVFNEKGYGQIKKLYKEIGGFNLAKAHNCETSDILNEKIIISVNITEYTDNNGLKKQSNSVAYAGFTAIEKNEEW